MEKNAIGFWEMKGRLFQRSVVVCLAPTCQKHTRSVLECIFVYLWRLVATHYDPAQQIGGIILCTFLKP